MIHLLGPSPRDRSEKRHSTWNRIAASGLRAVATFAVAVTAVVPVASAPAFAAMHCPVGSIDWISGDGNWSDASNWSSDPALPTAGDNVCVPAGVTVTVDANGSALQLASQGTLDILNNMTLTLGGPSETDGLILEGTIAGAGWLSLTGSGSWTRGTIATDVEVTSTGTLTILGTASAEVKNVTGRLVNNGTVDQVGRHVESIASGIDGGTITNNGTWYLSHPGPADTAVHGQASNNPGTFINNGLLERRSGTGEVEFTASVNLENYGTVAATSGILKFTATTVIGGGTLRAEGGASLMMRGSAATGASVTGSSTITGAGLIEWYGGVFTIDSGALVDAQSGFELDGAEIAGPGALSVSGTGTWVKGTVSGNLAVTTSGTLNIVGTTSSDVKVVTGELTNDGTVVQPGTRLETSTATSAGTITNNGLWQLTIPGNNFFTIRGNTTNPGTFTNNGILERTNAENPTRTAALTTGVELDNNGVVSATNGRLQIGAAPDHYAGTVFAGGRWEAHGGSTLDLPGTITVNSAYVMLSGDGSSITDLNGTGSDAFVRNNGTFRLDESADFSTVGDFANGGTLLLGNATAVSDASTFAVNGAFTNDVTGTVKIQIAGVASDHLYGEIVSTGATSLDGTIEAELLGSFIPAIGDVYQVMSYPSRTGTFATVLADPYFATTITGDATTAGGVFFTGVNQRPIADAGGVDYDVDEGAPGIQLDGSGSFDPDGVIVSHEWLDAAWFADNTVSQPTFANTADDGDFAVSLTVCDDGPPQECETDNTTVHVNNVDPAVVALLGIVNLSEGDTLPLTDLASFTDAGTLDTHRSQIVWGDGDTGPVVDPDTSPVSGSHTYLISGSHTLTVNVWDDDGGQGSVDIPVVIANVATTVTPGTPSLTEGDGATPVALATATDPGAETLTATMDWGDGSTLDNGITVNGSGQVTGGHSYADDGAYAGRICVSDDSGEVCEDVPITVLNANPTLTITTPVINGTVGIAISVDGTYDDDGSADTHTADIDWDDTTSDLGVAVTDDAFGFGHTYSSEGTYSVQVCVADDDGGSSCDTAEITVTPIPNDPPTVDAGGDYFGNEGSRILLDGTVSDPDGNLASTLWTSSGGSFSDSGVVDTRFNAVQDGIYTITLTGTDDLGASAGDQATVTVRNVHPSIGTRIFSGTLAEGSTITVSGGIGDPGVLDVHTATVEWFTGGPLDPAFVDQDANTYSASHIYLDDVAFVEIDLCISDGQDQQCNATHLDILNVAPSIDVLDVESGMPEGSTVNLAATFSDPGILDPHTATIDWNEGAGPVAATVGGNTVTGSNLYEQDGTYTVEVCVTDDDTTTCATRTTVIDNVAPSIDTLSVDTGLDEGSTADLAATFTDPGILDTHTASIDWGEGAGPIAVATTGNSIAGSNRYEQDGTYTVGLCVTDDDETTCRSTDITINNVDPAVTGIGDQTIDEGDTFGPVTLATFTDPGILDTHTATIDWGEGAGPIAAPTTANSVAGSNRYEQDGTYPVTVTVTDDAAGSGQHGFTVFVNNVAPTVDAGPDVAIDAGDTVTLDAGFSDPGADPWTATVDWGDGSAVEAASVDQAAKTISGSHPYPGAGTFTATVCILDDDDQGCDGFEVTVTAIAAEAPAADPGGPYTGDEGTPISIDGSASSDGDGTIVAYRWTADGGTFDDPTLAAPTFTAPDNGTYTVTLEVTDNDGLTDTDSTTVKVRNVAPSVNAGGSGPALKANTPSGLNATFTDPGADTHTATIDWGDGTPNTAIDPAASPIGLSHQYANPGQYMIRVTVTDDDGGSASDTVEVTVTGKLSPPTADPGGLYDGREGSRIRLSGSGSSDEDGEIVSYRWSADGGAFDNPNALRPRFTAPDNGTYTVTLEVTDNDGLTDTRSTTVEVSNVDPKVDAGRGATIRSGRQYRLRARFTDPGTADTHSAIIAWGDGTTTRIDAATSPLTLSHRYDKAGKYTVTVKVTDDDGGQDGDTVKVTVKDKSRRDRIRDWIRDLLKRLRDRMRGKGRWWR
jgi:hypothetical protein